MDEKGINLEKQVQDDGSAFDEKIKFRLYLFLVLMGLLEVSRPILSGEINFVSIIGPVFIIAGIKMFKGYKQLLPKQMKELRFFSYYLFIGISVPFIMFGFHVYGENPVTLFSAIMMFISPILWIGIFIYFRKKIKDIEVTE